MEMIEKEKRGLSSFNQLFIKSEKMIKQQQKPKRYTPSNVPCHRCNSWLARIIAIKVNDGYLCEDCHKGGIN